MTNNRFHPIYIRLVALISLALFASLFLTSNAQMQGASKPIKKEKMLEVLHKNLLPTKLFVEQVQQRGVDFQVTTTVETELRQAGARPELIAAARANYRATSAPVSETVSVPTKTSPGKSNHANISGPPLNSQELVTMLQSGVPAARVEKMVEGRGVSFTLNPDVARNITSAGGNRSLIGAIGENYKSAPPAATSSKAAPTVTKVSYEDLVDQATTALDQDQADEAIRLLSEAVKMDANKPMAYAFLGWASLYGKGNREAAEPFMRQAIERGGAAIFRASHDHDGFFKDTCKGSLFITKNEVTFKADDGADTFEATDALIKEVKTNRLVGVEFGSFHLKLSDGKNYNFAPATKRRFEAQMIINLITNFQ
jgi:tetratricopeptide (TPR) repeat protein